MATPLQRRTFDEVLEQLIAELPDNYRAMIEEIPVIVEDYPSLAVLEEMHIDPAVTDLCGLHSGIPLTRRSVEHSGVIPDRIMLFRDPIMRVAERRGRASGRHAHADRTELEKQIRITLLHEIGHHFGLDEDDLRKLGYA